MALAVATQEPIAEEALVFYTGFFVIGIWKARSHFLFFVQQAGE